MISNYMYYAVNFVSEKGPISHVCRGNISFTLKTTTVLNSLQKLDSQILTPLYLQIQECSFDHFQISFHFGVS